MSIRIITFGIGTAATFLASLAAAQPAAPPAYHPPARRVAPTEALVSLVKVVGETPRLANGKPDFSGEWSAELPVTYAKERSFDSRFPDNVSWEHVSWYNRPQYRPEHWAKVESLDQGKIEGDPKYGCGAPGVPRGVVRPSILMTEKQMWIAQSAGLYVIQENMLRAVPLDGRPLTEDDADQATNVGIPSGHWEGDTLVVNSTGFNDHTWFAWVGYFHSDRMTLQERFRRDGDFMFYSYTITDPAILTEPYTSDPMVWRINKNPAVVLQSTVECEPDPDQETHIVDRNFR